MTTGARPNGASGRSGPRPGERGRACPVCGAQLTSYNPGPNCYRHTVAVPWRGPGTPQK